MTPARIMSEEARPHGEIPAVRLILEVRWAGERVERHARAEVLVPHRRILGDGWSGWPAYLAGVRLLRALG
jgi:hypothetical protein